MGPGRPPAFPDELRLSIRWSWGLALVAGPKHVYTSICLNPVPGHA